MSFDEMGQGDYGMEDCGAPKPYDSLQKFSRDNKAAAIDGEEKSNHGVV